MRAAALLLFGLPSLVLAQDGSHRAHLVLHFTSWERGVSIVHASEQTLDLELSLGAATAVLRVRGEVRSSSVGLTPAGPGHHDEHRGTIDERFEGPVVRDGEAYVLTLTRDSTTALWPRVFTWRCEPTRTHPGALRCRSSTPLSSFPWENGHYSQVPIVLAAAGLENDIVWDGESEPAATVH